MAPQSYRARGALLIALALCTVIGRGDGLTEGWRGLNAFERTKHRPEGDWGWGHVW